MDLTDLAEPLSPPLYTPLSLALLQGEKIPPPNWNSVNAPRDIFLSKKVFSTAPDHRGV